MAKRKKNPASKQLMEHLFENYEMKTALDVQEVVFCQEKGQLKRRIFNHFF